MQRELSSFPLPPLQKRKLQEAGFVKVEDLDGMKPSELASELGLSLEDALEIIRAVTGKDNNGNSQDGGGDSKGSAVSIKTPAPPKAQSALDMLQNEQTEQNIITFSAQLDEMLGGGVPIGKVTEICGAPGVGKTQLCLQLCVDVQLPREFGGVAGQAVYIDTEGSFLTDRLRDIAGAALEHCKQVASLENGPGQQEALQSLAADAVLSHVHYFRCHDATQLIAMVTTLPDFMSSHPCVRLVVVDSIAFPFRHDITDYSARTRLLNGIGQALIKLATRSRLAVVLTNQMTTSFSRDPGGGPGGSELVPALGESWGHAATIRLILHWAHRHRHALLYKSPSHREMRVPYQVTMGGIRDVIITHYQVAAPYQQSDNQRKQDDGQGGQPQKRQRVQ